jgi:hypothetical protein
MTISSQILVIGAGELGIQVLRSLVAHPRCAGTVAVLLRPTSINSPNSAKQKEIEILRGLGLGIIPGDIVEDSEESLASVFANYDTIICCTGFVSGQGVQVRVTRAVLAANVSRFVPWQFGVDYDAIGRGSPQDLFDEQLNVRDLLRSQRQTRWAIISTGMFTSFLFEPSFGVVDLENATVCALGSLENQVTVTTPDDVGKITAEIVLGEESDALFADRVTFVAGDTVSYEDVACIVESLVQKPVHRKVLTVEDALSALAKDPDNGLFKYQAVFGQGHGVAWNMDDAWNRQRGMHVTTARAWAESNLL